MRHAFGLGEQPVEIRATEEPAVGDDRAYPFRIADVHERIAFQQDEVRELSGFDAAKGIRFP